MFTITALVASAILCFYARSFCQMHTGHVAVFVLLEKLSTSLELTSRLMQVGIAITDLAVDFAFFLEQRRVHGGLNDSDGNVNTIPALLLAFVILPIVVNMIIVFRIIWIEVQSGEVSFFL